jgi:hypothetical protein
MNSFKTPITEEYVARCIGLAERLNSRTDPPVSGVDLIGVIQEELPIPTSISELPPTGILGLCVNMITIVCKAEEEPMERILRALEEDGVEATCIPGTHDRESERARERGIDNCEVAVHRFQLWLPNPPKNQARALHLISKLQREIAIEAVCLSKSLLAVVAVNSD